MQHPVPGKTFPSDGLAPSFTIPLEWWERSGAAHYVRPAEQDCYTWRSSPRDIRDVGILLLNQILPAVRSPGVYQETYGFRDAPPPEGGDKGGLVDVLRAMISGVLLPPIEVTPTGRMRADKAEYQAAGGVHRFYASRALGFTSLPCVMKYWRHDAVA